MIKRFKRFDYPCDIDSDDIETVYPEVEKELKEILEKSGQKEKIIPQLKKRLKYLEKNRENCVLHRQWFEKYKGRDDWLYALRLKSENLNLRMFFSFLGERIVFLYAFLEKKKADTTKAKKVAKERYNEIKEK